MAIERRTRETTAQTLARPGQKLIARSIETLPISPVYSEIWVSAETNRNHRNPDAYVQDCLNQHVLPYSYLRFNYDTTSRTFIPERGEFYWSHEDEKVNNEVLSAHLRGYRIGNLIFEAQDEHAEEGFNTFREKLLNQIKEGGYYQIESYYIWFTSLFESERHDAHGQRGVDTLELDRVDKSLYLHVSSKLPRGQAKKLETWFNSLTSVPRKRFPKRN